VGSSLFSFIFILLLIILNGLFSMAEMAIVTARKPRLQQMAEEGSPSALAALKLAEDPGDFLSTVQIGITLIGILTGAFGGATLSSPVAAQLARIPGLQNIAEPLAVGLIVIFTTYLSLVVGELVPKRIALNNAERISSWVANPMRGLSAITRPLVWLLNRSSVALLRLLGIKLNQGPSVTEEEVRVLLEQGTQSGVFEPIEEEILGQVFRLSDRTVSAIMTPRTDMIWFDVDDSDEEVREIVLAHGHSRYPVARGDLDDMIGVVMVKDLLAKRMVDEPIDLEALAQPPLYVPESMPALDVIERLRETRSQLALVIDEYGGLEGIVTFTDIMSAILGDLPDNRGNSESPVVVRDDGSWLVDGMYAVDDFKGTFNIKELPDEEDASYQTLGGMVMTMLGRVPVTGNKVRVADYSIEVIDMDGRRVDKVLVVKQNAPEDSERVSG
jgi:putative hemolysin